MNGRILEHVRDVAGAGGRFAASDRVFTAVNSDFGGGRSEKGSGRQNMRYSEEELDLLNVDATVPCDADGDRSIVCRQEKEDK